MIPVRLPAGAAPAPRRVPRLALLVAGLLLACPAAAAIRTRHVVVVVVDGARWTETLGDPELRWHPRLGRDLADLGAVPGSMRNLGPTTTIPGHSAVGTGTWQPIANDGSERPHLPTLCEYLRAATGAPDSAAWIVAGKTKLDVLAYSDHPGYGATLGGRAQVGFARDTATMSAVRARLLGQRPTFLLVNLADTDVRGHAGDWPGYLAALAVADSLVWDLWNAIQADTGLADRTTLFVTNDHGRHDDAHGGFTGHGDGCEGCRRLCLVVAGPDVRRGYRGLAHYDLRDVALTAGYLLGVPMPLAEGHVMDELLLEPPTPLAVPRLPADDDAALHVSPLPARGGVRIAFAAGAVPAAGTPLEILDLTGRRVARLRAGAQGWTWDGRREDGTAASPGLYFARLPARAGTLTARIVRLP